MCGAQVQARGAGLGDAAGTSSPAPSRSTVGREPGDKGKPPCLFHLRESCCFLNRDGVLFAERPVSKGRATSTAQAGGGPTEKREQRQGSPAGSPQLQSECQSPSWSPRHRQAERCLRLVPVGRRPRLSDTWERGGGAQGAGRTAQGRRPGEAGATSLRLFKNTLNPASVSSTCDRLACLIPARTT